jgi:hypothetical protein
MSLEMAHKVIVPQKKIMSRSFLNSGTLIVRIHFTENLPNLAPFMEEKILTSQWILKPRRAFAVDVCIVRIILTFLFKIGRN